MNKEEVIKEIKALNLRAESFWVIGPAASCLIDKMPNTDRITLCMAAGEFLKFLKVNGISSQNVTEVKVTDNVNIYARRAKSKNLKKIEGIFLKSLDDTTTSFLIEIVNHEVKTIPFYFNEEVDKVQEKIENEQLPRYSPEVQKLIQESFADGRLRKLIAERINELSEQKEKGKN